MSTKKPDLASASAAEKLTRQIDLVKTSFEKNVAEGRELGDIVAKVGSEAADILSRHIVASLDEVKAATGRPKETNRTALVA
jgi:phasin family protein